MPELILIPAPTLHRRFFKQDFDVIITGKRFLNVLDRNMTIILKLLSDEVPFLGAMEEDFHFSVIFVSELEVRLMKPACSLD